MALASTVPVGTDVVEEFVPAGGVVVGDDGTEASRAAVRRAALDAVRRGSVLHVLRCWSLVTAPRPATWAIGHVPPLSDWQTAVRHRTQRLRAPQLADVEGLDVRWQPVHGRPETVLARASTGADLLVVGSRGRGELSELLLGSVAAAVLHTAARPVVVVRGPHSR